MIIITRFDITLQCNPPIHTFLHHIPRQGNFYLLNIYYFFKVVSFL